MIRFRPGEIIRFTYKHHPADVDEHTGERFKEVLVLHPGWMHRVHAIDLKRLTPAEREVLEAIMDKETVKLARSGKRPHRLPLVNDICRRMDPITEIKNPVSFYTRFVKVFLRDKDAYRMYYPRRMLHVTVIRNTSVAGQPINPKPMFGKENVFTPKKTEPTKKPEPAKAASPAKPVDRLALIRQRAQQKKPE